MPIFKAAENKKCGGKGGFKTSPKFTLDYITRKDKAEIVSSQYLNDGMDYVQQFEDTKKIWDKGLSDRSRKYYHFIHSFSAYDHITAEQAHQITEELCRRSFPDNEFVIATHTDTEHIHSHVVINSVSCITGKMLRISPDAYTKIKDLSNELAEEQGLTTVDFRKPSAEPVRQSQAERQIIMRGGTSWKQELCEVIDLAIDSTCNMKDFEEYIGKYGVEISRNTAKSISFRHPEKKKPIRGEKLGADYTKSAIEDRLVRVREHEERKINIGKSMIEISEKGYTPVNSHPVKTKHFMDVINSMAAWAEAVRRKSEQLRREREAAERRYYRDEGGR